ncbi:MAG TPA: DUF4062 domain-containing protein [Pyrinomonadaceae bacterium]|nr:DUF4062 domain-containing protein [Pyrinomonadaceae bacterium]
MDSDIFLFISSTSDLREERRALSEATELRRLCKVFLYEDFGAGSDGAGNTYPAAILRETLAKADVFVCLLGPRYGSLYNPPNEARPISIVEWEYRTAQEAGHGIEIMPFRKLVPEDQIEPTQLDFIKRVTAFGEGGRWCEKYDSPQTLAKLVYDSIAVWLSRRNKRAETAVAVWLHKSLAPLALGLVLLCILVSLGFVAQVLPFSQSSVFGFCALTFFTILLGVLALKSQTER